MNITSNIHPLPSAVDSLASSSKSPLISLFRRLICMEDGSTAYGCPSMFVYIVAMLLRSSGLSLSRLLNVTSNFGKG